MPDTNDTNDTRALETLARLCACPAVPYNEGLVAGAIHREGAESGIAVDADEFGNLVARLGPTGLPGIAFVAHMDHPGFEVFNSDEPVTAAPLDGLVLVRALGGVPVASLKRPTAVLVVGPDGERHRATIHPLSDPLSEQASRSLGSKSDRLARLETSAAFPPDAAMQIIFDLPDFEFYEDLIRARALDDLAGCAAIVSALKRLADDDMEMAVYGVFTRAEEEGLIGARAMASAGTLSPETIVVSVEASPVIPGVEQGAGPVVRTGDRTYSFDAGAEQVLVQAAKGLGEDRGEFPWQRALMGGGTCEATAFAVHGYRTSGIAFALGNYHNATTSIADPEGGVGAEYIAACDYLGGVDLIERAARSNSAGENPLAARLRTAPTDALARLRHSAGD
jgi:putative aminopeptidase FrvX